jgi:hypothetical protein
MHYPPLVHYTIQLEYRRHFERIYCNAPIVTFDGITVRFRKRDFDHAFFESNRKKDDTFSTQRAERMDWIKAALQDSHASRYVGWNNRKKRYDKTRRVTIVQGNYVVVIGFTKRGSGFFITAFVADSTRTLNRIRGGPAWT